MRILLVNKYSHVTGGADEHCLRLARGLRERGHQVAWLSTASARNLESDGSFIPPTVTHETRDSLTGRRRLGVAARTLWNPRAAIAARRLLDDFGPDLVHAHKLYPQLSVAPVLVAARRRVPVVQTLHDYELIAASLLDDRGSWLDHFEERRSYRLLNAATGLVRRSLHRSCVDRYISVSSFVAAAYRSHGVASVVIPNAAAGDPEDARPTFREREGAVFAGRLTREKGVLDVIALAERAPGLTVKVAGRGPLEAAVSAAAERLRNLMFLGWLGHEELRETLSSARVVVLPVRWADPQTRIVLEAMRAGTPVVAYDRGGLGPTVAGAGAGRVLEPSVEEMALACMELGGDESTWRLLSERGIAAVTGPYSRQAWLDATVSVYEELVARRAAK